MPLKATLVLAGGSLLRRDLPTTVEIQARPINLSPFGISVSLDLQAVWSTLTQTKEVGIFLERGRERHRVLGKIVHLEDLQDPADREAGQRILGLEFSTPLRDVTRFLLPQELQYH